METKDVLINRANIIINETEYFANDGPRVGGLIKDVVEYADNISQGQVSLGTVANLTALNAIVNPSKGDRYIVSDQINPANNLPYYYVWSGSAWVNTGETIINADAATKTDLTLKTSRTEAFNVSQYNNKYDYTDNASARNAVPTTLRGLGQIVTYKLSSGDWIAEQYVGSDPSGWVTESNWQSLSTRDFFDLFILSTTHSKKTGLSDYTLSGFYSSLNNGVWSDNVNYRSTPKIAVKKGESYVYFGRSSLNVLAVAAFYDEASDTAIMDKSVIGSNEMFGIYTVPEGINFISTPNHVSNTSANTGIYLYNISNALIELDRSALLSKQNTTYLKKLSYPSLDRVGFYTSAVGNWADGALYHSSQIFNVSEGQTFYYSLRASTAVLVIAAFPAANTNNAALEFSVSGIDSLKTGFYTVPKGIGKLVVTSSSTLHGDYIEFTECVPNNLTDKVIVTYADLTRQGIYSSTTGVWGGTTLYNTSKKLPVFKGQKIRFSSYGSNGVLLVAAFKTQNDSSIDISKSVIGEGFKSTGYYVVPDGISFITLTSSSVNHDEVTGLYTSSTIEYQVDFLKKKLLQKVEKSKFIIAERIASDGTISSDANYLITRPISVYEGQKIYYDLHASSSSLVLAAYDTDAIGATPILELSVKGRSSIGTVPSQGYYVVSKGVNFIRGCVNKLFLTDQTGFYEERAYIDQIKNTATRIEKTKDDLVFQNGWSMTDGIITSGANGIGNCKLPIPYIEDISKTEALITPTNDGNFEVGIVRMEGLSGTSICLQLYGSSSNIVLRRVSLATYTFGKGIPLPFTLKKGVEYYLGVTKNIDAIHIEVCGNNGDKFETVEFITGDQFGNLWGNPSLTTIVGSMTCSMFNYRVQSPIKPKLIIFGNSYSEGNTLYNIKEKRYVSLLAEALGKDNVVNMAQGGETAADIENRIYAQVDAYPDAEYCLLELGINDSATSVPNYLAAMGRIIPYIQDKGINLILTTTVPRTDKANLTGVNEINAYVESLELPVVYFDKALTTDRINWIAGAAMYDMIHPTILGHYLIFNRFRKDIPYLFS